MQPDGLAVLGNGMVTRAGDGVSPGWRIYAIVDGAEVLVAEVSRTGIGSRESRRRAARTIAETLVRPGGPAAQAIQMAEAQRRAAARQRAAQERAA